MPEATAFQRYPSLIFSKIGPVWRIGYRDPTEWPFALYARDVYHGTGRLLATLNFDREDDVLRTSVRILSENVDLLIAQRRERFAKKAAARIAQAQGEEHTKLSPSIETMVDAMLERLTESRYEVEILDLLDVPLPTDMATKYAVWPIVPVPRPGMIVAPSGSGKSTLAAGIALSTSHELEIIPGIEPRIPGPVIYIGQEEDREQMRKRVELMCRGHGVTLHKDRLIYMKLLGGSLIDTAERVAEAVGRWKVVLVIIDSAQATWGNDGDSVREYASKWFSSVERLGAPALIIEHPNLQSTKKPGQFFEAAGTSVKRDRAGHVWLVSSVELPVRDGYPYKYHVTLRDSKRNYVGRQPDIVYETIINGYEWQRFMPTEALTADTVVDSSHTWAAAASVIREDDEFHEDGWTVAELQARLKHKDDKRLRAELKLEVWRPHPTNTELEEKAMQVEGTGTNRDNPARYKIVQRKTGGELVQLSFAPGGDESPPS